MPDKDEFYVKYRVFHEPKLLPSTETKYGHPITVEAKYLHSEDAHFQTWEDLIEVDGLHFVLRPENDHHARVAMAAYAYSCRQDFPHLAADIIKMVEEIEWEEQTGSDRGDFPLDTDDYLTPSGDQLDSNVVEILRKKTVPDA